MKKLNLLLITTLLCALLLTACGGGGSSESKKEEAPTEAEATTAVEATTEAKEALTDDDCFDIVFADAPVDEFVADNKRISRKKDGTILFTFTTVDGDYSYKLDAYTGEILEKTQPEKITTTKGSGGFDDDDVFDALGEICPVDYAQGKNLKIKKSNDNASLEVSFNTEDGDFFYRFDRETGELLEKREPENITEKSKVVEVSGDADDPFSVARNECCKVAGVNPWEAEDLNIKEVTANKIYEVTFKYKGKDYDLIYDMTTGKVEEN